MIKQIVTTVSLIGILASASAENAGQGQSIMFQDRETDRAHLTTMPDGQKKKTRGDRCVEMSREIEALKGRPQRRSTMMERYRAECDLN